jgi:hypothetical protein
MSSRSILGAPWAGCAPCEESGKSSAAPATAQAAMSAFVMFIEKKLRR